MCWGAGVLGAGVLECWSAEAALPTPILPKSTTVRSGNFLPSSRDTLTLRATVSRRWAVLNQRYARFLHSAKGADGDDRCLSTPPNHPPRIPRDRPLRGGTRRLSTAIPNTAVWYVQDTGSGNSGGFSLGCFQAWKQQSTFNCGFYYNTLKINTNI